MNIQVQPCSFADIAALRQSCAHELNCQFVHYSFIARSLADTFLIENDGKAAGYGAISNHYDKGKLVEFYTLPGYRRFALPMFRHLLSVSQATQLEAQSNMPLMLQMLLDCGSAVKVEKILFDDALSTQLSCPQEASQLLQQDGEFMVERQGEIVAKGGYLTHYNPPYADIYMEVNEAARRQGFGSFLVQELKRACYTAGYKPAARCDPENTASRRTLEKAGLLVCGHLLVAAVNASH